MAVYVVTGKLGGGKSIISVKRILDKLIAGCTVATNLDLNLQNLVSPFNKTVRVIRIPDKPTIQDLHAIGKGTDSYDENKNGLLVLDECGTWFNSRNWQDKARTPVNEWFLHARKLGWDVILIIQDIGLLDSQARSAIAEHTVFCRRTDRLAIPFIGTFIKALTGSRIPLPKVHLARVVYGTSETDLLVDRWACHGTSLYAAYDTKQSFIDNYPHGAHSLLPPYFTHGRYMAKRGVGFIMRLTKIYWRKFRAPVALSSGLLAGTAFTMAGVFANNYYPYPEDITSPAVHVDQVQRDHDTVMDSLPDLSILGSTAITNSETGSYINYDIGSPGDDENPPVVKYRTTHLVKSGYNVKPISECAAEIIRDGKRITVYCL